MNLVCETALSGWCHITVPDLSATHARQFDVPAIPTPARLLSSHACCWSLSGAGLRGIMKSLPNGLSSLVSSGKGSASGLTFLTHQPSTPGSYHREAPTASPRQGTWASTGVPECLWVTQGPDLPDSTLGPGKVDIDHLGRATPSWCQSPPVTQAAPSNPPPTELRKGEIKHGSARHTHPKTGNLATVG